MQSLSAYGPLVLINSFLSNTSIWERAAGMCADVLDQGVIMLMWDCKLARTGLMETLQKLWFRFKR